MTGNEETEIHSKSVNVELSDPESEKSNALDFSDDQSCDKLIFANPDKSNHTELNTNNFIEHDLQIIDLENKEIDSSCASEDCNKTPVLSDAPYDILYSEFNNENKENTIYMPRTKAIMHPPSEKPLCENHQSCPEESVKVDCDDCFNLLLEPSTSISQIFAAMREWMPGSQKKMNLLVEEITKKGAHVDDMDGLEGNTMLHYACKSASEGVGSSEMAQLLVKHLLHAGANYRLRARWTDMLPLHFAAYFNCPEILNVLLDVSDNTDIDARCKEYDQGTALHMAASGLCFNAAQVLFDRGADPTLINNKYKTPFECIADGTKQELRQTPECLEKLKSLLKNAKSPVADKVLQEIGLSLGDDVLVGGEKSGTLKFCGKTDFASGVWCGIELHEKVGKNNGSVAGVTYFKCKPEHGMFAPPSKLSTLDVPRSSSMSSASDSHKTKLQVGDRVNVIGCKLGYVRFVGKVKFSGGTWVGVELDKPYGKCNGTLDGVKYFACKPQHGVLVYSDKVKRVDVSSESKTDALLSPKVSRAAPVRSVSSPGTFERSPVCASPMRGTHITPAFPASQTPLSPALTSSAASVTSSSVSMTSPVRPVTGGVVRSGSGSGGGRGTSPGRSGASANGSKSGNVYKKQTKLQPGMNAFVNGELGTVKYVGRVDFADGIWIGVHLKNPTGKNDGMVQGKRYFLCKAGFGIMVKPSKVTIHGISATKLIDEADYPE